MFLCLLMGRVKLDNFMFQPIVGTIIDYSHITPGTISCADRDCRQIVFFTRVIYRQVQYWG
jgi:hypothetical protein